MTPIKRYLTPKQAAAADLQRAQAAVTQATIDYNVMMGNLEDPAEEVEPDAQPEV